MGNYLQTNQHHVRNRNRSPLITSTEGTTTAGTNFAGNGRTSTSGDNGCQNINVYNGPNGSNITTTTIPTNANTEYHQTEVEQLRLELRDTKRQVYEREQQLLKLHREIHKLRSVLDHSEVIQALKPSLSMQMLLQNAAANTGATSVSSTVSDGGGSGGDDGGRCNTTNSTNKDMITSAIIQQQLRTTMMPQVNRKKQGVSGESYGSMCSLQNGGDPMQNVNFVWKDFDCRRIIQEALLDNSFLKEYLNQTQLDLIIDAMYEKEFPKGTYICKRGTYGSHLYVITYGHCEVIDAHDKPVNQMGPGKSFGELALLYNCTRTASVKTITSVRTWILDRRVFQMIMMKTCLDRTQSIKQFLRGVPLLRDLSDEKISKISDVVEVDFYPRGDYICRQGSLGDSFYIISKGSVRVTRIRNHHYGNTSTNETGNIDNSVVDNNNDITVNTSTITPTKMYGGVSDASGGSNGTTMPPVVTEETIRILTVGDYFGEQALLAAINHHRQQQQLYANISGGGGRGGGVDGDGNNQSPPLLPPSTHQLKQDPWSTMACIETSGIRTASVISEECECLVLDQANFLNLLGDLSEIKHKSYEDDHLKVERNIISGSVYRPKKEPTLDKVLSTATTTIVTTTNIAATTITVSPVTTMSTTIVAPSKVTTTTNVIPSTIMMVDVNSNVCSETVIHYTADNAQNLNVKQNTKQQQHHPHHRTPTTTTTNTVSAISTTSIDPFINRLTLDDIERVCQLGMGGFGLVYLVRCKMDSSKVFALKRCDKLFIRQSHQEQHIINEKLVMQRIAGRHQFVCQLYRTFRDEKSIYFLLEPALGGELWTVLRQRGPFTEQASRFYLGCVIEALQFLHSNNIIYRDLKPENCLLDEFGYLKLTDFGFSKFLQPGDKTWTFCGTPEYVAPEIVLNRGHDFSVDIWAVGILLYELLTGIPPFTSSDVLQTYHTILRGFDSIGFDETIFSKHCVALIRALCRENPTERLGVRGRNGFADIRKHKWFSGFKWDHLVARKLVPPIVPHLTSNVDTRYFDVPEANSPIHHPPPPPQQQQAAQISNVVNEQQRLSPSSGATVNSGCGGRWSPSYAGMRKSLAKISFSNHATSGNNDIAKGAKGANNDRAVGGGSGGASGHSSANTSTSTTKSGSSGNTTKHGANSITALDSSGGGGRETPSSITSAFDYWHDWENYF